MVVVIWPFIAIDFSICIKEEEEEEDMITVIHIKLLKVFPECSETHTININYIGLVYTHGPWKMALIPWFDFHGQIYEEKKL